MFVVMFRTLILFVLVIVSMRIMGKRQIGQLQPYELAVLIMVSALAAIPMEDIAIPLFNSIIPIILLVAFPGINLVCRPEKREGALGSLRAAQHHYPERKDH